MIPPSDHSICMHHYKTLFGSLNWIAACPRPDLTPTVAFLSSYNHRPSPEHIKATIYSLMYINSTPDLEINLSSTKSIEPHSHIHHPSPYYKEDYIDASDPRTTSQHELMGYSYAYWGSKV